MCVVSVVSSSDGKMLQDGYDSHVIVRLSSPKRNVWLLRVIMR